MKLRFRGNSLRLRLNRREVESFAAGVELREQVVFPGAERLEYALDTSSESGNAIFQTGEIRVSVPQQQAAGWARGAEIGMYFELPANGCVLKVAIEKDLECVDGAPEEKDPHAFPRPAKDC